MIKNIIFIFILNFLFLSNALSQDSAIVQSGHTAFTLGIGLPSGLSLSINQKVINPFYIMASIGTLIYRNTINAGCDIRFTENSSSNVCFRYTVPFDFTEDKSISFYYKYFNFNSSSSPFFWGIGLSYITGHHDFGGNILPFAELGIRLSCY